MSELQPIRDRADSGKGRPYSTTSLENIARLEGQWQPKDLRKVPRHEMVVSCAIKRESFYLSYPTTLTADQARAEAQLRDLNHRHWLFEVVELESLI